MIKGYLGAHYKCDNSYIEMLRNFIRKEDIYDNDNNDYGITDEPHVTVLYGFDPSVKVSDIKPVMCDKEIYNEDIEITGISLFENENFDVLKLDIKSDRLNELHNFFDNNFPNESDFDEYIPHLTISYLKKGSGKYYTSGHTGKDLVEKAKSKLKKCDIYYEFSDADKKKTTFTILR